MKLRHTTILISMLLAMSACDQKSNSDRSNSAETGDESRTAAIAKEPNPLFPAEVFLESRSPDAAVISFSLKLEETRKRGEEEASKSWTDFKLQGGSVCNIFPTFIEHRDGYDVWRIELKYEASDESDGAARAAVSKEILFDGKSPAVVTEDQHHTIVLRPQTTTNSE